MGYDDIGLPRSRLRGSSTQEPDGNQCRVVPVPMASQKAAFGRSFGLQLALPDPTTGRPEAIRRLVELGLKAKK